MAYAFLRPILQFGASLGIAALVLSGCGGGGGGSIAASTTPTSTPAVVTQSANLVDAPVKGACYYGSPSGTTGTTDANGAYNYVAGDVVSFWIDVSGNGCGTTAPSSTSTTAIALGSLSPMATQTFVLAFTNGLAIAQTLQALNHGSANAMDVSGITVSSANSVLVSNANSYISTGSLPTGAGSVDQLYYQLQQGSLVGGTTLTPVLPASNTTVTNSPFSQAVNNTLNSVMASGVLGGTPTSVTISSPQIIFNNTTGNYGASSLAENTPYFAYNFQYRDGAGNGLRLHWSQRPNSPLPLTPAQQTFTYTVSGNNVLLFNVLTGNGSTPTQSQTSTVAYSGNGTTYYSGVYTKYNSGLTAVEFGNYTGSGQLITPMTQSMLAGHTISLRQNSNCNGSTGGTLVLAFDATGATFTPSGCGSPGTFTVSMSPINGVLIMTNTSVGETIYLGLAGASLTAPGATFFAVVEDNPGTTKLQILPVLSVK